MTRVRILSMPWAQGITGQYTPVVPPGPPPPFVPDFFVAPTPLGSASNPGTELLPWSLTFAASGAGGALGPDAKVGFLDGLYDVIGLVFATSGTAGHPIIWRDVDGAHARIRGIGVSTSSDDIQVSGSYNWFWGLDFQGKNWSVRNNFPVSGAQAVVFLSGTTGNKLIHPVIHDGQNGIYTYPGCGDLEIYGPIIYNCGGWDAAGPGPRGYGHGTYLHHNDSGGTTQLLVEDAISFNHFYACFQAYGPAAPDIVQGIKLRRGIFFNPGVLSNIYGAWAITFDHESQPITRCECNDTVVFCPASAPTGEHLVFGNSALVHDSFTALRNYLINGGGLGAFASAFVRSQWNSLAFQDNFVHVAPSGTRKAVYVRPLNSQLGGFSWSGNDWRRDPTSTSWIHSDGTSATFANWQTATGLGSSDTASASAPTLTKVVVQPTTRYESGRGHIWYMNWAGLSSIPVDLAPIVALGNNYTVHDVRDIWGAPILNGNYGGGTVNFPTTQVSDPAVVGGSFAAAPATAPDFNAFLVRTV